MQADKNIKNLFDGFENEFRKGDWSAIESKVLDNNRRYLLSKSKFMIGAAFGMVACIALGLVHFGTTTFNDKQEVEVTESNVALNIPLEESKTPIFSISDILAAEEPSKIVEVSTTNSVLHAGNSPDIKKQELIVLNEEAFIPVNEKLNPKLPKFTMHKTTYCLGEKLEFISDSKSIESLSFKWNNKRMTLDEFKQFRLSSAGNTAFQVLENGKIIQQVHVVCQAPMARIGYKKNYDIDNPYVQFSAMNSLNSADYEWYVDGEPIASADEFEYTFASKGMYSVKMVVRSSAGCKDSSVKSVRILRAYNLMATTVYNPEFGKWLPLGLKKEGVSFRLRIIDQAGKTIFTSIDLNNEWDGSTAENMKVSNGDLFYWVAQVTDVNGKISEYGNSLLINSELE
ncbi:MAG: PKD repeat protein [Salibacteraceae bacterium]|jgi:PKD repeat protein|tara:strand:+ start:200 stop:1396 length:1197 start_codon:yes stop_codon:yes gene_type:complete